MSPPIAELCCGGYHKGWRALLHLFKHSSAQALILQVKSYAPFRWMYWHFTGGEAEAQRASDMPQGVEKGSLCQGYAAINDALILLLAVH